VVRDHLQQRPAGIGVGGVQDPHHEVAVLLGPLGEVGAAAHHLGRTHAQRAQPGLQHGQVLVLGALPELLQVGLVPDAGAGHAAAVAGGELRDEGGERVHVARRRGMGGPRAAAGPGRRVGDAGQQRDVEAGRLVHHRVHVVPARLPLLALDLVPVDVDAEPPDADRGQLLQQLDRLVAVDSER